MPTTCGAYASRTSETFDPFDVVSCIHPSYTCTTHIKEKRFFLPCYADTSRSPYPSTTNNPLRPENNTVHTHSSYINNYEPMPLPPHRHSTTYNSAGSWEHSYGTPRMANHPLWYAVFSRCSLISSWIFRLLRHETHCPIEGSAD